LTAERPKRAERTPTNGSHPDWRVQNAASPNFDKFQ
jgi:hypothetical protein